MPTTPQGIEYPDSSGHTRLWEHFQALAESVDDVVTPLVALDNPWTTYVPVWTASTTNPVLNNGTIVGRYTTLGKTVYFRVIITMGSTTTYGSGQYSVSLPVAAHPTGLQIVNTIYFDGTTRFALARIIAGATTANLYAPPTTAGAADRLVTNLVPFTWANTNVLVVSGTYEAA